MWKVDILFYLKKNISAATQQEKLHISLSPYCIKCRMTVYIDCDCIFRLTVQI